MIGFIQHWGLQDGQSKGWGNEVPDIVGTHTVPKDGSDHQSLVPAVSRYCFVSPDPDYASDWDMHVFYDTFIQVLEWPVADTGALTEGMHRPAGLDCLSSAVSLTFGFFPDLCSLHTPEQHNRDGSPFLACGLLLGPLGTRRYVMWVEPHPFSSGFSLHTPPSKTGAW